MEYTEGGRGGGVGLGGWNKYVLGSWVEKPKKIISEGISEGDVYKALESKSAQNLIH